MRVAYFPDSFHEVNGVAHTSRNFEAYARRHSLPFLCVRAGTRELALQQEGSVTTLELHRSRAAFALEKDLSFDPLFSRHHSSIEAALLAFRPDVIHVTGPSELGMFGAYYAWKHNIPLAASWHTNVHEYLARRMEPFTRMLPALNQGIETATLGAAARFYQLARVLFAPNQELCALLEARTGKPCALMQRGVDTELFTPAKRLRADEDTIVLGYVGRLSIEKNVGLLGGIERELRARGIGNTRFRIIGHGNEEDALRASLTEAEFPGVLRGEALAEAYAGMDIFVFPSMTDTFGNVVLEALASGVPAVVTTGGGPRFVVRDGETGFIRPAHEFVDIIGSLIDDRAKLDRMRLAARQYALGCSWDAVFDRVYAAYAPLLSPVTPVAPASAAQ